MLNGMFAVLPPENRAEIEKQHLLGLGCPSDIAHAIAFLLSRNARWITGITLPVDGGYTAH
jgi:NAD(P)-dependent dehydrogenase (short-subunit alcohol dehydrogenase family)